LVRIIIRRGVAAANYKKHIKQDQEHNRVWGVNNDLFINETYYKNFTSHLSSSFGSLKIYIILDTK
jgi:hypothetical protein